VNGTGFWEELWRTDPDGVEVPDQILATEVAHLMPGTLLDLGCGRGTNALALAARGWSVLGVDVSPQAVALARREAARGGFDAAFEVGELPGWTTHCRFDLVVSTFALPEGAAGEATLRQAAALVKPGGELVVAEWDISMQETWGWSGLDLFSVERIVRHLPGLEIRTAEVRDLTSLYPEDDPRAGQLATNSAYAAVVRAARPGLKDDRTR
jgi:2-polyprenyl-3-methyl-5-hydroxy-6-metoxy-1,4-benzoquinol methylase